MTIPGDFTIYDWPIGDQMMEISTAHVRSSCIFLEHTGIRKAGRNT